MSTAYHGSCTCDAHARTYPITARSNLLDAAVLFEQQDNKQRSAEGHQRSCPCRRHPIPPELAPINSTVFVPKQLAIRLWAMVIVTYMYFAQTHGEIRGYFQFRVLGKSILDGICNLSEWIEHHARLPRPCSTSTHVWYNIKGKSVVLAWANSHEYMGKAYCLQLMVWNAAFCESARAPTRTPIKTWMHFLCIV